MVLVQLNLTASENSIFLKELDQHTTEIENAVVKLEQGAPHLALIEQLFRNYHTIKGNAGIADYEILRSLAHEIENTLSKYRNSGNQIPAKIIDLLFKSIDVIKKLREPIVNPKLNVEEEPVKELVKAFNSLLDEPSVEKASEAKPVVVVVDSPKDLAIKLEVYISSHEMLPAVRLFQVVHALTQENIQFSSEPSMQDIQDAKITLPLLISLNSIPANLDSLINKLLCFDGISAIKKVFPLKNYKKEDKQEQVDVPKDLISKITEVQAVQEELQEVQINIKKLDSLINLLGEILINRNKIAQNLIELEEKYTLDPQISDMLDLINHLGKITYNLQTELLNIRTIPLHNIIEKYPRLIRDLAKKLGKKVKLEISGQQVELDRLILKYLNDMIIHVIRNSVDHGIETPEVRLKNGKKEVGVIKIDASQKHNKANFVISDDGNGIDPKVIRKIILEKKLVDEETLNSLSNSEVIKFVCHPGFSTKKEISDISGRGVGMDVVQNTVQRLGGQFSIESEFGKGTQIRLTLPLTLAIVHGLVSLTNNRTFIIPISYVDEVVRSSGKDVKVINKKPHIMVRNTLIPLVDLKTLLYGKETNIKAQKKLFIVIVNYNDQQTGIMVDKLVGEEDIVIKNIDYANDKYYIIHSATIMGTGEIGLILDIASLLDYVTLKKGKLEEDKQLLILSKT